MAIQYTRSISGVKCYLLRVVNSLLSVSTQGHWSFMSGINRKVLIRLFRICYIRKMSYSSDLCKCKFSLRNDIAIDIAICALKKT